MLPTRPFSYRLLSRVDPTERASTPRVGSAERIDTDPRHQAVGLVGIPRMDQHEVVRLPVLPTSLVGSYPQPDWLIDRDKLAGRFPPRVRAKELWRVEPALLAQAQDDATELAIRAQERAGPARSCASKGVRYTDVRPTQRSAR